MRCHTERDQRLHPTRDTPLHDEGIIDDLLVISMCYEAHLSMQQMLAALSEMRGDDAVDSTSGPL